MADRLDRMAMVSLVREKTCSFLVTHLTCPCFRLFLLQAPLFWLSMLLTITKLRVEPQEAKQSPTLVSADDEDDESNGIQPRQDGDAAGGRRDFSVPHSTTGSKPKRVDFLGMITLALSVSATILLLDAGGAKFAWTSTVSIILFLTAILGLVVFVVIEAHFAREPIFTLRILRQPNVLPSYLVMTLQTVAQVSLMYCVPLYFQVTADASATNAGAHLVPAVVGNAIAGLATGAAIRRSGRFKSLAVAGGLVGSISYILIFLFWNGAKSSSGFEDFWKSLYIVPGGMSMGMAQASVFVSMTSLLHSRYMAMATSGLFLFTNLGLSIGITLSNAALDRRFRRLLEKNFTGDNSKEVSSGSFFFPMLVC